VNPGKPHKESLVRKFQILLLALTLTAFAAGSPWAADPKPAAAPAATQAQTKCPVLGGNINQNVYADYQGKRIYFCCDGCITQFHNNPEKYLKMLEEQGVTLEPAPAAPAKK
jgi:YHS domain-containing protein